MKTTIMTIVLLLQTAVVVYAGAAELDPYLSEFYQALEAGDDATALITGQTVFEQIERTYRSDTNFGNLKTKLIASDFLGNRMVEQLRQATRAQLLSASYDIFDTSDTPGGSELSIPKAISFYETSKDVLSRPVSVDGFSEQERLFLARYYDLRLRTITSSVAQAGQALAVAEPDFTGTYDYVLVLPLLHSSENRPVNINILPNWMRRSSQLKIFSDSCLMHYGYPYHAKAFAASAAEQDSLDFSPVAFYEAAAGQCADQLPRVAVDCLQRAIEGLDDDERDHIANLNFEIIRIWQESGNHSLAAGQARRLIENFPEHDRYAEANWLYYYSLSRANNTAAILSNIDSAVSDPRCSVYRSRLLYIKWWALRRQRDQGAALAAVEHQLLSEYGHTELVAPIMLSRATDLLARQQYAESLEMLNELQESFPNTQAAHQARRIAERLAGLQQR